MEEIDVKEPKLGPNLSPKEQVFSNALLVDYIWEQLDSENLLRASLVSKAWFAQCRKELIKNSKRHPVCIQISDDSPCRTLVKFITFLEETYGSNDDPVIFNGIQIKITDHSKHKGKNCIRLSREDPLRQIPGVDGFSFQKQIYSILYEKILEKVKFRYLRLENYTPRDSCPFSHFLNLMITRNSDNILKWKLKTHYDQRELVDFLRYGHVKSSLTFPNLKTLSIKWIDWSSDWSGLQTLAPALKGITRLKLDPLDERWRRVKDFPFHAVQNLGDLEQKERAVFAAISFIQEFNPKIKSLIFDQSTDLITVSEEFYDLLFQLGRRVSSSLTSLHCSPSFLKILASKFDALDRHWLKNEFPALESLELAGSMDVNVMDWFGMEDISKNFSNLKHVKLGFVCLSGKSVSVPEGPNNRALGFRRVESVKTLMIKTWEWKVCDTIKEFFPRWLNLFGNIIHLCLIEIPFKYDCDDRAFAEILGEINNLPLLEELTIRSTDWSTFCLDHLFTENIPKIEMHLEEKNLKHLLVYKASLLDNKTLKQINIHVIHGDRPCTERQTKGKLCSYSGHRSGTFLVSNRTAELIRKHVPGFKFCVITTRLIECGCTDDFYPASWQFENLETLAKISFKKTTDQYRWEIEFLNMNDEIK